MLFQFVFTADSCMQRRHWAKNMPSLGLMTRHIADPGPALELKVLSTLRGLPVGCTFARSL